MSNYTLTVGNIGNMEYTNKVDAMKAFNEYVELSRTGVGRGAYEDVTLMQGDKELKAFYASELAQHLLDENRGIHIYSDFVDLYGSQMVIPVTLAVGDKLVCRANTESVAIITSIEEGMASLTITKSGKKIGNLTYEDLEDIKGCINEGVYYLDGKPDVTKLLAEIADEDNEFQNEAFEELCDAAHIMLDGQKCRIYEDCGIWAIPYEMAQPESC